ncbi:MAG: heterodisulfide reductase-related iron-sulfur binding cluster [Bryobacteraceae bacterium]
MADSTIASDPRAAGPTQFDLDKCVHCGLCLNACPTYRELGLEMDSPRGRVYQMVQVSEGALITPAYLQHIGLCLACRGCESACPSGVPYGRMVEHARAEIEASIPRGRLARWLRAFLFGHLIQSRALLSIAGTLLYLYEASGLKTLARSLGLMKMLGRLGNVAQLAPSADPPFFFSQIGKTFPAEGVRRYRVAFLSGCVANISFARLHEASLRVLQHNGCEVVVPAGQGCCGALHLHSGLPGEARALARRNIEALRGGAFDAIVSNSAGCGAMLKEYGELLAGDPAYATAAHKFAAQVRDITEFLASIELNLQMGPVNAVATYQDACHLAHAQRVRSAPRTLLAAIPGLVLEEMSGADICCGSAGSYNIVQNEMSLQILARKMEAVNRTGATIVATANPGCELQIEAGVRLHGKGQHVMHVVELLDLAYRNYAPAQSEPRP